MTSPNPKGLAAYLETDPEEVAGWVENGQLRLFAATLSYLTYTVRTSSEHKVAEIRTVLDPLLEQTRTTWDDWWDKKVRDWVKDSKYFSPGDARYTYRLAPGAEVDNIPVERLVGKPKSAKASKPRARSKTASSRQVSEDLKLLRESNAANLKQQRESHAAELKQQQETYAAELRQQRASHAADLEQQREAYAAELKRLKESHDSSLERWQREEERLYNRINTLIADKAALREESRLEIRQEMLLRVGDIIQRGYQTGKTPESRLDELMEILPYALRDGGAQPLGTVGEIVQYDPRLHHSPKKIAIGGPVRLTAPGVVVIGGSFGDKIILKANVTSESEAT